MKVRITVLKAPWPKGAKVGDVVELKGDHAPGWAIGKFERVEDSAEATIDFPDEDDVAEHPEVARIRQAAEHALSAAAAERVQMIDAHAGEVRNLKSAHTAELATLQARVDEATAGAGAKLQELLDANAALSAKLAEAQAALAAAQKAHTGKR